MEDSEENNADDHGRARLVDVRTLVEEVIADEAHAESHLVPIQDWSLRQNCQERAVDHPHVILDTIGTIL